MEVNVKDLENSQVEFEVTVPSTAKVSVVARGLEDSKVEFEITVPAAELDKAYEAAYKKVASKVNIPGFRKGKAPKMMVERHVGKE